jgi:membrane associated rhomboid family serine protease
MFGILPPATRALILVTTAVYLVQIFTGDRLAIFELWPIGENFRPWQVITYAFLHSPDTVAHIFFNMFALFMFGRELEHFWGTPRFVAFYFASVLAAAATQLITTWYMQTPYPTLGASGGIFGLLLAFAMFFPRQRITLLFPPIPMPAWLFVTLYGLIELFLGVTGTQAGVAHFAHLGGMLGGYLTILIWRLQARSRQR